MEAQLGQCSGVLRHFQIILEAAYEKYVSAANQNNQNYQEIARLGYVSKAYLVLAAIGTSGGALNLLAQMLINQANQYEADQRIPFLGVILISAPLSSNMPHLMVGL